MCWPARPSVAMLMLFGVFALTGCTPLPIGQIATDLAMLSRPDLYRGTQYHPHASGPILQQPNLELAPGVGYRGCVAALHTSQWDADAGRGLDCAAADRISFEPGVRYGDCAALRHVTVAEARNGAGLLCDTDAGSMRAATTAMRVSLRRQRSD